MINYIIYDSQGNIVQGGEASPNKILELKNKIVGFKLLELKEPLGNANEYRVVNGVVERRETAAEVEDYMFNRYYEYGFIGNQLDLLYKDIQAGLFGEAAKAGQFAAYISSIKGRYPKP